MLSLDDHRWGGLLGGYRMPFDPRPFLTMLEADEDTAVAWHELWEGLHHQGDIGEVSYAAVPHLVRIYESAERIDWNAYAIVAVIELARDAPQNPGIPEWLREDYQKAIAELAKIGTTQVLCATDDEDVRAILSVIAIAANARTHARFLLNYSSDELLKMEK